MSRIAAAASIVLLLAIATAGCTVAPGAANTPQGSRVEQKAMTGQSQ
jgi:hypothetical protein